MKNQMQEESDEENEEEIIPQQNNNNNNKQQRLHFTKESTSVLKKWLIDNIEDPYLKYSDKITLSRESGLTHKQIQNWFTNVRKVRQYSIFNQQLC